MDSHLKLECTFHSPFLSFSLSTSTYALMRLLESGMWRQCIWGWNVHLVFRTNNERLCVWICHLSTARCPLNILAFTWISLRSDQVLKWIDQNVISKFAVNFFHFYSILGDYCYWQWYIVRSWHHFIHTSIVSRIDICLCHRVRYKQMIYKLWSTFWFANHRQTYYTAQTFCRTNTRNEIFHNSK